MQLPNEPPNIPKPDWSPPGQSPEIAENGAAPVAVVLRGVDDDRVKDVLGDADAAVELAGDIKIDNDRDYDVIGDLLTGTIKPALAAIEKTFRPMQRATDGAHKEVCAQRARHEKPLLRLEELAKASMLTYHQEQEQIVAQEEAERLEAARKVAEDIKVEEAARLERDGHQEAADERLEEPVAPVIAPAPRRAAPKAAGTSVRKKWDFQIDDPALIDRKFLTPDLQKIRGTVTSMGPDAAKVVGGITVIERASMAAAAR